MELEHEAGGCVDEVEWWEGGIDGAGGAEVRVVWVKLSRVW